MKMRMSGWTILVFAALYYDGVVRAFQWDTQPGPVVYSCTGKQVLFPWSFKTEGKERVVDIHWIFNDAWASQMVATMAHDHFQPTDLYGSRARHGTNGGLSLSDVTTADSGTFTIEVNMDIDGSFFSHQHTVTLQVSDGLTTQGGVLRARQDPVASWDDASQQWTIRLTCGHFLFQGQPPIQVTWTTPQLEKVSSTGYDDGDFYLALPSPVVGGNYTCQIPPYSLSDVCVDDDNNNDNDNDKEMLVADSVFVDEMKARVSVLEAEQKTLREGNESLGAKCESQYKELQSAYQQLAQENQQLQGDMHSLRQQHDADFEHLSRNINDSRLAFEEKLQSMRRTLEDQVRSLRNESKLGPLAGVCAYGAHHVLNDNKRSVDYGDDSLCDKNLSPGWYRFLLNGADAVVPTQCVPTHHCGTDAPFWLDLQGGSLPAVGAERAARACAHWSSNCCNWEAPITVRNCGPFFLYKLTPINHCSLSYCTQPAHR